MVNQLYENIDVGQGAVGSGSRRISSVSARRSPARSQQPATQGVTRPARSGHASQQLFINASAIAHEKLVNVLEDKTGHGISTGNGVVTLDLHELIVEVGTELGLPPDALAQAAGQGRDGHADEVGPALGGADRRPGGARAERLAARRRARALRARDLPRARRQAGDAAQRGLGLALVGLLVLVIRHLLGNYLVDSLASPGYQPATHRL